MRARLFMLGAALAWTPVALGQSDPVPPEADEPPVAQSPAPETKPETREKEKETPPPAGDSEQAQELEGPPAPDEPAKPEPPAQPAAPPLSAEDEAILRELDLFMVFEILLDWDLFSDEPDTAKPEAP